MKHHLTHLVQSAGGRLSRPGINHEDAPACEGDGPHAGRPELVGDQVLCPACAEKP